MAILADLCCQSMAGVFASSISAVVTTEAVARYVCMIKIRWPPCHGRMAVIAIISTSNVCWMFANCDISVVTGHTGTNHLRVIHNYIGLKERCVVTIFTNITGRYVILPFTGCIRSVVASDTIVGNAGVVKRCRDPAIG